MAKAIGCGVGVLVAAVVAVVVAVPLLRGCGTGPAELPPPSGPPPNPVDGIALAIVVDTSGSMKAEVPVAGGGRRPKFEVAGMALSSIVDRIEAWRTAAPKDAPRRVEAALVTFAREPALPMAPFDPAPFRAWADGFRKPDGPTPLGRAVRRAGGEVLRSPMISRHVLVITDGENTDGPRPEEAMEGLRKEALAAGTSISVHFVAFDVAAEVFAPVKALGASVAGAADGVQLERHLKAILEEEILLESAGPAKPAGAGNGR